MAVNKSNALAKRREKIRFSLKANSDRQYRIVVKRSNKNIHAQLIDNNTGAVLASSSSLNEAVKKVVNFGGNVESAKKVGEEIAKKALEKGVKQVVFDRSGYIYHGRIKALADAAREAGLDF